MFINMEINSSIKQPSPDTQLPLIHYPTQCDFAKVKGFARRRRPVKKYAPCNENARQYGS
jgi:hypothetical protein